MQTPILNSNSYINNILNNDIVDPYVRKLVNTTYSAATKHAMSKDILIQKELSMEGFTTVDAYFIDGDTIKYVNPKTGEERTARIKGNGNFFDTADKMKGILASPAKIRTQPTAINSITGKAVLTDEDAENVSNYQAQQMYNQLREQPVFETYDSSRKYESVVGKPVKLGIRVTGVDDYNRDLAEIVNPITKQPVAFDASNNPYLNTRWDFYKSIDSESNRKRLQHQESKENLDKFITPNTVASIYNQISDTDNRLLEDIDIAQSTAYRSAARVLQYAPFMDKEHWAAVADEATGQQIADAWAGVKTSTRRAYANGMLEASNAWKEGNYAKAITGWVSNIDRVVAESATQTGLILVGSQAAAAAGAGATIAGLSSALLATADATLASMESYEANNNGQKMSAEQVAQSFALNFVTMIPETMLTALNVQRFLPKPVAKEFNVLFKTKDDIKKTPAYKTVLESAGGEFGQEWLQSGVEEYVSQNQKNAKSLAEVMTSGERVENAIVGALAGGATSTGLAIANAPLNARADAKKKEYDSTHAEVGTAVDENASKTWSTFSRDNLADVNTVEDIQSVLTKDAETLSTQETKGALSIEAKEKRIDYVKGLFNKLANSKATPEQFKEISKSICETYGVSEDELASYVIYGMADDAAALAKEKGVKVEDLTDEDLEPIIEKYRKAGLGTYERMRKETIVSDLRTVLEDIGRGESSYVRYALELQSIDKKLADESLSDSARKTLEDEKQAYVARLGVLLDSAIDKLDKFSTQAEELADNPDKAESSKVDYKSGKGKGFVLKRADFTNARTGELNGLGSIAGGLSVISGVLQEALEMNEALKTSTGVDNTGKIAELQRRFLNAQDIIHGVENKPETPITEEIPSSTEGNTTKANTPISPIGVIKQGSKATQQQLVKVTSRAVRSADRKATLSRIDAAKQIKIEEFADVLDEEVTDAISKIQSVRDAASKLRVSKNYTKEQKEADLLAIDTLLKQLHNESNRRVNEAKNAPKEDEIDDVINDETKIKSDEDLNNMFQRIAEATDDEQVSINTVESLLSAVQALLARVKEQGSTINTAKEFEDLIADTSFGVRKSARGYAVLSRTLKLLRKQGFYNYAARQEQKIAKREANLQNFKGKKKRKEEIEKEIAESKTELEEKISQRTRGKATTAAELEVQVASEISSLEERIKKLEDPEPILEEVADSLLIQSYTPETANKLGQQILFKADAENILTTRSIDELIEEAETEEAQAELTEIKKFLDKGYRVIRKHLLNKGEPIITEYAKNKKGDYKAKSNSTNIFVDRDEKGHPGSRLKNAFGYLSGIVAKQPLMNLIGSVKTEETDTQKSIQFTVNTVVSDVIVSSVMEYIATYDMYSLLNPTEDSDILEAFGLSAHDYEALPECKRILKEKGVPERALIDGLGALIARNLGIHPKATADMYAYGKAISTLGTLAVDFCTDAGIFNTTVEKVEYKGKESNHYYIKGNFKRIKATKQFYINNNMAKHLKAVKDSSYSNVPRTTKGNPPQNMSLKTKLKLTSVPGYYYTVIKELWNTPFTIDKDLVNLMVANKEAFRKRLGYVDIQDPNLTYDELASAEGINRTINKQIEDLENALKSIDEGGYADADGNLMPIFFNWFMSSNGRLFMQSSTINPQTGKKLQRFLVTPSASYKTFSFTEQELKEEAYAIAQAFDELKNNDRINKVHEVMTSLTMEELDVLESYVINGITNDNRAVMCDIFTKLGYKAEAIAKIAEGTSNKELLELENFGQALSVIKHLKLRAENVDTKTAFTTNLSVENDSTTSGYDLKFLLFPELQQEGKDYLPKKTGILVGEDVDKVSDTHSLKASEGFLDIYKTTANEAWKRLPATRGNIRSLPRKVFEALEAALPKIENGEVSKELRTLMKSPTMIFGYSASENSLENKVAEQLAEMFIKKFMAIDINILDKYDKGQSEELDVETKAVLNAFKELGAYEVEGRPLPLAALKTALHDKEASKIIVNFRGNNYTIQAFLSNEVFKPTYGKATSSALTSMYAHTIEINNALNTATKIMSECLRLSVNQRIAEYKGTMTDEQYKLLLEQHRNLFPEVALLFSNSTVDGLNLVNAEKIKDSNAVSSVFRVSPDGVIGRHNSNINVFGIADPGLRGAVLPIHFTDGMLLMMTMQEHKGILPVFDALVMSAFGSTEASTTYNRNGILIGKQFDLFSLMEDRFKNVTETYKYQNNQYTKRELPSLSSFEMDNFTVGKRKFNSVADFTQYFSYLANKVRANREQFYNQTIGHVNMAGAQGSKAVVQPDERLDLSTMQAINSKNRTYFYPNMDNSRFYSNDSIQEVFGNLNSTERLLTAFDMLISKATQLGGTESDTEYVNELRSLLSSIDTSILQNVELRIQEQHTSLTGQFERNTESGKGTIYVGFNPKDKDSNLARLGNTAVETFTHEVIHAATVAGIALHKELGLTKEVKLLENLRGKALDVLTWKDFMPENTEGLSKKEIALLEKSAKNIYNKITNVKDSQSLAEFLAMGVTNKKLMNKLKGISLQNQTTETSLFDRIINTIKNVFSVLFGKTSLADGLPRVYAALRGDTTDTTASNVHEALLNLMATINAAGNEASKAVRNNEFSMFDSLLKALGGVVVKGDKMSGPAVSKLFNIFSRIELSDTLINSLKKNQSYMAWFKAFGLALTSKKARYQLKEIIFRYSNVAKNQLFMSFFKDLQDTDDASKALERIGLHTRNLDTSIQNDINTARVSLIREFGRELTREEKRSLVVSALRTDLSCLLDEDASNLEDIKALLTDDTVLASKIEEARTALDGIEDKTQRLKVLNRIKTLSYYMATGNGNFDLHFNAAHILKDCTKEERKTLIPVVDKLATYYALQLTDTNAKQQLALLPNDGLQMFLNTHRKYVLDADMHENRAFRRTIKGSTKFIGTPNVKYSMTFKDGKQIPYGISTVTEISSNSAFKNVLLLRENFYSPEHREGATFAIADSKVIGDSFYANTNEVSTPFQNDIRVSMRNAAKQVDAQFAKKELSFDDVAKMSVPFVPTPTLNQPSALSVESDVANDKFDFRIVPNHDLVENTMKADMDGIEVLSNMFGHRNRNMAASRANKVILDFLVNDMANMDPKTHRLKNKDNELNKAGIKYVALDRTTQFFGLTESEYRLLPTSVKQYIKDNGVLYVREDWLPDLFGVKTMSIANAFKNPKWKYYAKVVEFILKAVALVAKNNVVFRTPAVIVGNIVSNMTYCIMSGNSYKEVTKAHIKYSKALTDYLQTRRDMETLEFNANMKGNTLEVERKLQWYQNKLENNPVHPLIKAGLFQAIIEDIDTMRNETIGGLARKLKETKAYNKSPKWVKEIARQAFMVEGTFIHDTIYKATQYSDFVARCIQYEFLMKQAGLTPGDTKTQKQEEAIISEILEAFINYDKPSSSIEQWANDMGLVMFTKYFKRIQRVLRKQVTEKPISSLLFALSQMSLVDVDDILEQNLVSKNYGAIVHTPLDNIISAFTPQLVNVLS